MDATPAWVDELINKYSGGISHTFILHGAVDDYVTADGMKLDDYLTQLLGQREMIIFYNCSTGVDFAIPSMRTRFRELLGLKDEGQNERLFFDPFQALPVLETLMTDQRLKGKVAVIFEMPELIWPDSDPAHLSGRDRMLLATLRRWATSSKLIAAKQIVLLPTNSPTDLHSSLRTASSMIEQIEIPYPGQEERAAFIRDRLERYQTPLADTLTVESFAALTGGLSRVLVDDIRLRAAIEERPIDLDLIKQRKDQIIRSEFGELIEILEPRHGFDAVGGLEEVKQYLRRSVVAPLRREAPLERMPAGVLLAGPPGTGKTFLVAALAHEAGVNVVKLNAGRLLGQYVGNSERNLERALSCIRSLAPTIVMIDEIEQQFQRGGGGDSGVGGRLFGRILEEMSGASGTRRGDVLWFAATNRIDRVDAALRRPGRFDRIVPILPPATDEERWALLQTKFPMGEEVPADVKAQVLAASARFTGADLDGVRIKAHELAIDAQRTHLTLQDILTAFRVLRPSSDSKDAAEMTDMALAYCNDLSLVPAAWREHAQRLATPTE